MLKVSLSSKIFLLTGFDAKKLRHVLRIFKHTQGDSERLGKKNIFFLWNALYIFTYSVRTFFYEYADIRFDRYISNNKRGIAKKVCHKTNVEEEANDSLLANEFSIEYILLLWQTLFGDTSLKMEDRYTLIAHYFACGLQQKEIIAMMDIVHNYKLHPRTLKRILRELMLYRRKRFSPITHVVNFISDQLDKSGQLHGYRWMHLKCIQHGLVVTQKRIEYDNGHYRTYSYYIHYS
ncbi:hypothetical protein NQ315_005651 [Exocentrus adspersus]|uniref:Uncharacterized protein n=1 Tax=Exocentrus adspersus TaxID=1586481 RepID=A0AAV8V701_9CUCU|nr:hypothetical protein NQ315_005651 [Exocentrus adspersus]